MHELRPYQVRLIDDLRLALATHKRVVGYLPTGGGKSHIISFIALSVAEEKVARGSTTWIITPRLLLVDDLHQRFTARGIPHGVISSQHDRSIHHPVQIITNTSAVLNVDQWKGDIEAGYWQAPDLIIVDECDFGIAGQKKLAELFPNAFILGFTASPIGLEGFYKHLVHGATLSELTLMGYLVPAQYYQAVPFDASDLRVKSTGDYDLKDYFDNHLERGKVVGDILKSYYDYLTQRKTFIYAGFKPIGNWLAQELSDAGVPVRYVDGKTPKGELDEAIEWFRSTPGSTLVFPKFLGRGVDIPEADALISAAPTRSLAVYIQTVGRVLRPAEGKSNALFIDHAGWYEEFGLIYEYERWSLKGKPRIQERADRAKARKERKTKEIVCECGCVYRLSDTPVCPACFKPPIFRKAYEPLDSIPGHVVAVSGKRKAEPYFTPEDKRKWYAQLLWMAAERGYKIGWAAYKYREKFGHWPEGPRPKPQPPTPEVIGFVKYLNIRGAKRRQRERRNEAQTQAR